MKKKTYSKPRLRSLDIDTNNLMVTSLPKTDEDLITDQGQFNSKIWKFMEADANAAASQQADEEEDL